MQLIYRLFFSVHRKHPEWWHSYNCLNPVVRWQLQILLHILEEIKNLYTRQSQFWATPHSSAYWTGNIQEPISVKISSEMHSMKCKQTRKKKKTKCPRTRADIPRDEKSQYCMFCDLYDFMALWFSREVYIVYCIIKIFQLKNELIFFSLLLDFRNVHFVKILQFFM